MRNKKTKWGKDAKEYIIKNYGSLSTKEIAEHLKTTANKVRCKAAHLRGKGQSVFKYPFINWRDPEIKTQLFTEYGGKPTHQIAEKFDRTTSAIYRAARDLGISFKGNEGRYTFVELAKELKIQYKAIKKWPGYGLKISGYAKDSFTYSLRSRKKTRKIEKPKYFCALIDLDDLKRFLKLRPEACDLAKLDQETKHLLELNNLNSVWEEKKVNCKCNFNFWTALYNQNPKCPKCGKLVSKWAVDYR